ncbi:hypothetical protein G0U57_008581, partial [Chelydra serpentina]
PGTPVGNGSQLTAREGDSLRFLCSVASSPPATLGWVTGGPSRRGRPPVGGESAASGATQRDRPKDQGAVTACPCRSKEEARLRGPFQLCRRVQPPAGDPGL